MYIANSSRQDFRFHFRLPESNSTIVEDIPSGQQVEIGKGWSDGALQAMMQQLERYGAREAKEARRGLREFDSGLIYSLDKPVSENEIYYAWEQKLDYNKERAVNQATRSALSADVPHRDKGKRQAKEVGIEVEAEGDPKTEGRKGLMDVTVTPDGATNVDGKELPIGS